MKKPSFSLQFAIVLFVFLFSSCNSSRLYKDYNYSPRENAPDISGNVLGVPEPQPTSPVLVTNTPQAERENIAEQNISNPENEQKIKVVVHAFREEMAAEQETVSKNSNRELIKKVSNRLVEEGQISNLSPREEKKLDRMAAKMDKKLKKQGNEIDWRNNTPLELFFMIMAIAGLVLGIVSVSFGWFVFIVFAGLWLYFKLVEDHK